MNTPIKSCTNKNSEQNSNFVTPLKIPQTPFLEKLGYGTGVQVFRVKRSPKVEGVIRSPWAIKRITKRKLEQVDSELIGSRLLEEAAVLRSLKHINIVGFRDLNTMTDGRACLAMEDCQTSVGDILEVRYDDCLGPLPADQIKIMCTDVAKALNYLHTEAMLLHGDLKSFNILVKGDFEICKLCDFGVTQPVNKNGLIDTEKKPFAAYVGTDLWSAPEVFSDDYLVGVKADIFAFGMVIYETIACQPPHTVNNDDAMETTLDDSDCFIVPTQTSFTQLYGTRPLIPDAFELSEDYSVILEIFYVCTNEDPNDRPAASVLMDVFKTKVG